MTSDPRPGIEEHDRPHGRWLSRGDIAFGIGVGLVLAAVLVAFMPDARTHLSGGTDRRSTTVTEVREGTRAGDSDRPVTTYALRWQDGDEVRTATFRRSGPPRRDVGDTWTLWVSPDGSAVETDSPLTTGLWLGVGLPAFTVLIGVLVKWRQGVLVRAAVRADRRRARRQRT